MSSLIRTLALLVVLAVLGTVAGCGGPTPSSPTASGASPSAVSTAPTGSPTAASSPTAVLRSVEPSLAARVLDAFVTGFVKAKKPFHEHVDLVVDGSSGPQVVSFGGTLDGDISGAGYRAAVLSRASDGTSTTFDLIRLDEVTYSRPAGGKWKVAGALDQTQPVNPFTKLDVTDLRDIGVATVDGRELHRLRTTHWNGEELSRPDLTEPRIAKTEFSVLVDEGGTPVAGVLDFRLIGKLGPGGFPFDFLYRVTYTFSAVGEPVEITKPEVR